MYKCAFCQQPGPIEKFFGCPGTVYRPNMYTVCDEHKEMHLTWEDVYPTDDCKPITRHEDKVISKACEKVKNKYAEAIKNLADR